LKIVVGSERTGKMARSRPAVVRVAMSVANSPEENVMNRRSILGIAAMMALGLSVLSGSVVAQQKSLKDQLIGTEASRVGARHQ
jgi:hypothetical protein